MQLLVSKYCSGCAQWSKKPRSNHTGGVGRSSVLPASSQPQTGTAGAGRELSPEGSSRAQESLPRHHMEGVPHPGKPTAGRATVTSMRPQACAPVDFLLCRLQLSESQALCPSCWGSRQGCRGDPSPGAQSR